MAEARGSSTLVVRLLALVMAVVLGVGAFYFAQDVVDRLRADQPLTGTTVGEPGCVTSARVTTPDGVERTVSLLPPRGRCLARVPDTPVTVWVDPDDPTTLASSRAWWWPALFASTGALVAAASAVVVVRGPQALGSGGRGRVPSSTGSCRPRRRSPARRRPAPDRPVLVPLDVDDEQAAYRWDHVLGRAEVVRDRLRAADAADDLLGAVDELLDRLHDADLPAARSTARRIRGGTAPDPAGVAGDLDDLLDRVLAGSR